MKKEQTIIDRALPLVLFWGVVLTDLLFLGAICAPNPYIFDISAGVTAVGAYIFLHLAIFVALFLPALLMTDRGAKVYTVVVSLFFSLLTLIYVAYYRFFNTLPSVSMVNLINFDNSSVPDSASNFMIPLRWYDFVFFIYLLPYVVLNFINQIYQFNKGKIATTPVKQKPHPVVVATQVPVSKTRKTPSLGLIAVAACAIFTIVATPVASVVLSKDSIANAKSFTEEGIAYTPLGGFIKDVGEILEGRRTLTSAEREGIDDYFEWNSQFYQTSRYTGTLKGKNVIYVQLESIENFVIGMVIDGQEITPNLNALASAGYYFPNVHDQVTSGNSSDCDFLSVTSILVADRRVSLKSYTDNTFNSLPKILSGIGYGTTYYSGTKNSNWGYQNVTKGIGYDEFDADYVINESTRLNTYISDKDYFLQTVPKLLDDDKSFASSTPQYAHMVCCSSHAPYVIPEELQTLTLPDGIKDTVVGDYLQAVHYTDAQVGLFVQQLKQAGILDNTVLAFIGDHLGPHKYYPEEFKNVPHVAFKDVKDDYDETVPFIVYSGAEDIVPTTFSVNGGQVDVMPTLLDLLGVDYDLYKHSAMGRSLVATKADFAISGNGKVYGTLEGEDLAILKNSPKIADLILEGDYFATQDK